MSLLMAVWGRAANWFGRCKSQTVPYSKKVDSEAKSLWRRADR